MLSPLLYGFAMGAVIATIFLLFKTSGESRLSPVRLGQLFTAGQPSLNLSNGADGFELKKCVPGVTNCSQVLVFAMYYPQFHPIPENDEALGDGFTEWKFIRGAPDKNVYGKGIRKPTTLGYYDLREYRVRQQQGELAKQYGVDGMFMYHYWLDNHVVMGKIAELLLKDGQPNRPWAFLWANEAWTSVYGFTRKRALEQKYDDPAKHARYLVRMFKSPLYLFINRRPILGIYILHTVPHEYLQLLRAEVYTLTGWNLFIAKASQWHGGDPQPYSNSKHADAIFEFFPNLVGHAHKSEVTAHEERTVPLWRGAITGWDPTPRYPDGNAPKGATENVDLSAKAFQATATERMRSALCESDGHRTIFALFAWNEWGEGAVLEPNTVDGNGLLEAVHAAKLGAEGLHAEDRRSGRCQNSSQRFTAPNHFAIQWGELTI